MARIDGKLWKWSSESFQTKRKIHPGSRQKNHSIHGKVLCQEKIHIKKRSHLCWSPYQVKFQDNNFITFIAEVISFYDWNPGGILEEYRSHLQNSDQKVWKITIIIFNLAVSTSPVGVMLRDSIFRLNFCWKIRCL